DMPFAPADAPVVGAQFHDDGLEFEKGAVGELIGPHQRQAHHAQGDLCDPHAIRSVPLICVLCMMRRAVSSNGSRRCRDARLFHMRTSPTRQTWHIAKRGCVACDHSASSNTSLSATSRPRM